MHFSINKCIYTCCLEAWFVLRLRQSLVSSSSQILEKTWSNRQLKVEDMCRTKSFKEELSFEQRVVESRETLADYPDRVPVIVEKYAKCDLPQLDKRKYLVPGDMSVGQFIYILSERLRLDPGKALFVFVKNTLPPLASLMNSVYDYHKDEDGFLYLSYSTEKTFG